MKRKKITLDLQKIVIVIIYFSVIFFNNECNFCNSTVDLIIKNDKKNIFRIFGYSPTMQKNRAEIRENGHNNGNS